MKTPTIIIGLVALVLIGGGLFVYSGAYDVAATSPHGGFTTWLFNATRRQSVERQAKGIDVPELDSEELRLAGINDFNEMCAGCHTAPGAQLSPLAQGLNPAPPDLDISAENLTPEELFWIMKFGIKMTGMPGWGPTHSDEDLWGIVAFMQALPGLSGDDYQAMLAAAEGRGHHGANEANGNHSPDEYDSYPGEEGSVEHDEPSQAEHTNADDHNDDGHTH